MRQTWIAPLLGTLLLGALLPQAADAGVQIISRPLEIERIPDGVYAAETFVDSDGIVNEPLRIALQIKKEGTELYFDFTGTNGSSMRSVSPRIANAPRRGRCFVRRTIFSSRLSWRMYSSPPIRP